MKTKTNYWPHAIVISTLLVVAACIATIKVALDNPVEMDTFYLTKYHQVDDEINTILAKQKLFDAQYAIAYDRHSFTLGQNNVQLRITDKATGTPVDKAHIELLITRPDSSQYDVKLTPTAHTNGTYSFANFAIEKIGRWRLLAKIKIGDHVGFIKTELLASK